MSRSLQARGVRCALVIAAWFVACAPCWAQGLGQGGEYQVKAAFLYKFAGYVEWPDGGIGSPETPFTIGVLGAEALAGELTQVISGRTLNDRSVSVRRLKPGEPLGGVHMLFLGRSESMAQNQLHQWTQRRPVLVVTESEGALEQGSMINFVVIERRVRFEIAPDAAEKSGLRLSSRLLAVAQKVSAGAP